MSERSVYEAPQAELLDPIQKEQEKLASRWTRFGAHILDYVLFYAALLIPIFAFSSSVNTDDSLKTIAVAFGGIAVIAYIVYNIVLLHRYGQTLGKRLLKIKIVSSNDERANLKRLLLMRIGLMWVLYSIPAVGALVAFVNIGMIFGKHKECLHDVVAGTKVVEATICTK